MLALVTALVCLAGVLAAGAVLVNELVRPPTADELRAASKAEVAGRWRIWEAGKVFPERLSYTSETGGEETARRVGIAPGHTCSAAVRPAAVRALRTGGCRAGLRATYLDQPQGVVVTVALLAFADPKVARQVADALGSSNVPRFSLRALPVPRTAAAKFTDAARQKQTVDSYGPYVVLSTAGYADGRPREAVTQLRDEPFAVGGQLAADIAAELARTLTPNCAQERVWDC
ncbi:MAG: hypothetical protein GEV11_12085 [Streptosporangiales bacterium]|nr:hypothetical protein [Streptosporangiales bacterium]